MGHSQSWKMRGFASALLVMVSAVALAGCQSKTASLDSADGLSTGSLGNGSLSETAKLGDAFEADPKNAAKGLAYASGLESIGQTDRQLEILKQLADGHPGDAKITAHYAKKLIGAGRGAEAIPILEQLVAAPGADWRIYSALGSAYDQDGKYEQARAQYSKALELKPDAMSVLNNLGMSYALQGDLKQAEATLRKASQNPKANTEPRIQQNLALVVGLQGRFDEAREIAGKDLPPDQVEANMAYLQKMLSQSNTWQQLSDGTQG